jgi:hypothetical protein
VHQYVCWKLKVKSWSANLNRDNRYVVVLEPGQMPPGIDRFDVRAYFDETEFTGQLKKKWPNGDGTGRSVYVSGRIEKVDEQGVVLTKCRVVAGRPTEPPPT